jgi:parallel beta-helix repeat protein
LPAVDRELLIDPHGNVGNRSPRAVFLATIIVAVLVVGAIAGLMAQLVNNVHPSPPETRGKVPAGILYTTHSPISIFGNAEFTTANGVSGGAGTASDPYIIADWDINASTANGIWIHGTDAHFVVRDCYVHDGSYGSSTFYGIYLDSYCTNGTVENNTCSYNYGGIALDLSSNNTLINNNCSSNAENGIFVDYSSNNTLSGNNCDLNGYDGIYLYSSGSNTMSTINCSSNSRYGIHLALSGNNTLINNNCSSNGFEGFYLSSSSNFNVVVSNRGFWNTYGCIDVSSSSNNMLINNNCSSNGNDGMYLGESSNNTLINNNCSSNTGWGIYLYSSSNNTLSSNNCSSNSADGIELDASSDFNVVVSNRGFWNAYNGIDVVSSSNNTLNNNNCSNNDYGIWLESSCNNSLTNNTCSSNEYDGIFLYVSSNNNHLGNNTCTDSSYAGIDLYSSRYNTLINNKCMNNEEGIFFEDSNGNNLIDNNCSFNQDVGIYLSTSNSNNSLSNNICSDNRYGIELVTSNGNTLCNNTCISNDEAAIDLRYSDSNTLCENNFSSNRNNGILLVESSSNNITRNQLYFNVAEGLWTTGSACSNNMIWNNTFMDNNGASSTYDPSHIQASDDGTANWWNSTEGYGNYWSDWTAPDVNPPYGIVDEPYNISGSAGAKDFYPLTWPPGLILTSPNGGEQWQAGMTYQIGWTWSGMVFPVALQLYKGGTLDSTIVSSTANTGTYDWTIPASQVVGTDYKVRIGSADGTGVSDQSDDEFSITGAVTLTAPNGGERWIAGTTSSITWTSTGGGLGNMKIDLYEGGSFVSTLAQSPANDGSFDWSIPANQTVGSDYRIKLESTTYSWISDDSDNDFTIGGSITVTSPNGGEEWAVDGTHYVNWTYTGNGLGSVKIELYNGTSLVYVVATSTTNNGSYVWTVPDTVTLGSNYRIRITSIADIDTYDESNDPFSIVKKQSEGPATTSADNLVIIGVIVAAIVLALVGLLLVKKRKKTHSQAESEKESLPPTPPEA